MRQQLSCKKPDRPDLFGASTPCFAMKPDSPQRCIQRICSSRAKARSPHPRALTRSSSDFGANVNAPGTVEPFVLVGRFRKMGIQTFIYDAMGADEEVPEGSSPPSELRDGQLLWIDVEGSCGQDMAAIGATFGITPKMFERVTDLKREALLDNYTDSFAFAIDAPGDFRSNAHRDGVQLGMIVGKKWLITVHREPVRYLSDFRAQDKGETEIGKLSPALLAASLLDWHLTQYFEEVSKIEEETDRLDAAILADGTQREILSQIVAVRTRVSKLRAQLSSQRAIFYGFLRPDFALNFDREALCPFERLVSRYERAIDEVERTRDVVVGSFDLYTSITTQQTNDLVKLLTFLTAVIGFCAAVAGLLGMNFKLPFFESGMLGFELVLAGLVVFGIASFIVAKWRKWV